MLYNIRFIDFSPHPEEQRSCVSKEDSESAGDALILRDTAFGGPQDEG
jgi:hypothetical protein